MKLYLLACEVLARPLYLCAARSTHIIDIQLVRKAQHNTPILLRKTLQGYIDAAQGYDAVLLGYGLCGQATAGLAARQLPLVLPRAHDCITLFLGSRERYNAQFEQFPGTYWYAQDYIERDDGSGSALSMGSGTDVDLQNVYAQYVEKYGQDNADYLMEVMGAWQQHYQRAAYVDLDGPGSQHIAERAQAEAARRGWTFERIAGDLTVLHRLVEGDWEADFLVVPPGSSVAMSYDDEILKIQSPGG